VKSTQRAIRTIPASVVARRLRQVLQTDEQTTVRGLDKPILYLRSVGDRLVSEKNWKDLQKVRPDAQIVRLKGPHMLLQTAPKECWQAITTFVEKTSPDCTS
jgi:pimeloyl-ACP methyl ester carboxylesterase